MRRTLLAAWIALGATACLAQNWPEVTAEARPGTRWWWLGSAVDSANITRNLDEYARVGIGSVEITPIYGVKNNERNEISFLSPEWLGMLRHVENEAARNGILVDMNQGTGWPFGGPEVTEEWSACKLVVLTDTVDHGAEPVSTIPEKERRHARPIASSRRTLDDRRDEIIRLYMAPTRQAVKRAAPGGEGLVIDHFDRDAVSRYLDKFDNAFEKSGTPYPHNFFNDSYEVFKANWTPTLFDEFEKRRGYRLQDKLPELLGYVDDGNAVLSDYRETLGELLLENFTEQWVGRAHSHGVQIRNQAHGSPANLIDIYAAVDIPEIEGFGLSDFGIKGLRTDHGFTRKNDSDVSMLKYASSAAHIAGKPLTSSETFTWLTEHFRTSLSQMKPDLDLMFTCGVNHMFFHGTTYSPTDDPWPGWKFYASVDMSPTNSIWRDAPALMNYITRCQSFLQQGQPDNDFLIYLPVRDMWKQRKTKGADGLLMSFSIHEMGRLAPDFIKVVMEIDSLGFDSDYISEKYLMSTDIESDRLVTAAGTPYKALIIPAGATLSAPLQAHLDSLKAKGAIILSSDDHVSINNAARSESMRTKLGMRAIRRATGDGHIYFMANLTPDDINAEVPLTVDYADALWFDPMTGAIERADFSNGKIKMNFRSGESRILRTYDRRTSLVDKKHVAANPIELDLTDNNWKLSFIESSAAGTRTFDLNKLQPWTSLGDKELDELMGTGVYETSFEIPAADTHGQWTIELGDVRESARVYVNGKYAGTAWAVPFALDCSGLIKPGHNDLRIEVTNLPANRIAALDRQGVEWRKFKEINLVDINYRKTGYDSWETMPSGLNSTVKLVRK